MATKSFHLLFSVAAVVKSQDRVAIWSSTLDSDESLQKWYGTEYAVPGIVNAGDSLCPEGETCYVGRGQSELYRYNSTVGFHSVELSFSLRTSGMTEGSEACEVYSISGMWSNSWSDWGEPIGSFVENGTGREHIIRMPEEANDEEIVGVDFFTWGSNDSFCRLRNVELSGIEITEAPTVSPTAAASNEQCLFLYSSGAPWPLDSCYYKTPSYSYGLYCTQHWNGSNFANKKVVELLFDGPDCDGGLGLGLDSATSTARLENVYDCDPGDVDCNCDGVASACEVVTRRTYDVQDEVALECSDDSYADEMFVTNVCLSRGGLGSIGFECDDQVAYGVKELWFESVTCSGERTNTPSPSTAVNKYENALCVDFSCAAAATTDADAELHTILVAVAVVAGALLCLCLLVVACGWRWRKRHNKQVYFDNNNTTNI